MGKRKYRNSVYKSKENKSLYDIWRKIKWRCFNENCDRYKDYGGRGISVCTEWKDDFDNFADWAKENGYSTGLTIERKNVDGNYCPENCCWITKAEQARNKRNTIRVTYRGIEKTLIEWCNELNLSYDTMHDRITVKKWSVEKAFEKKSIQENSFSKMCKKHNLNPVTVRDRVHKLGWTLEEALNTPTMGRGSSFSTYKRNAKKICLVCGKEFERTNSRQKYCSYRCKTISRRKSYRETGEITNYHNISKNPGE